MPPIRNNADWPQVVKLESYLFPEKDRFVVGTGTLIHPRVVLTAGHVLYDPTGERVGKARRVKVKFSRSGDEVEGDRFLTTPEWEEADSHSLVTLSAFDLGVVILARNSDVTPAIVFVTGVGDLVGRMSNLVGYPANDEEHGEFVGWSGTPFAMASPRDHARIRYPFETVGGVSGGPVYRTDESSREGRPVVRAVHTDLYLGCGNGLMINPGLGKQITNWIQNV